MVQRYVKKQAIFLCVIKKWAFVYTTKALNALK